jgi:hypothetical protein
MENEVFFRLHKKQPYEKIAYCAKCDAPLKYKGLLYEYRYQCNICNKEYCLDDEYPRLLYLSTKYDVDGALTYWAESPGTLWTEEKEISNLETGASDDKPQAV